MGGDVYPHVLKSIFTSRSLQGLAPAIWNCVPIWISRKQGRVVDSALPEPFSCPGPDEFTYLNQELCSQPRLALLLLLVPNGGKLTPSNAEKLTLHSLNSWQKLVCPGLTLKAGKERVEELEVCSLRDV